MDDALGRGRGSELYDVLLGGLRFGIDCDEGDWGSKTVKNNVTYFMDGPT